MFMPLFQKLYKDLEYNVPINEEYQWFFRSKPY